MSTPVIAVENLAKRYTIGHNPNTRDGLRHAIEGVFRNPVAWLTNARRRANGSHEDFWALKDVSFTVEQGEVLGIIGRNGAGKSTLLKILSRITEPTTGRIELSGRVASLLEVGTGFHQELTGRENIFLNGAILGMTRREIQRRFDEIVAFSEVEKFLDTPVKRYSSGMYVRLAFAVAAHLEPEILIVDEVLAVGDAAFQAKCLGRMQNVAAQEGRTVLFVSHQMTAVQKLCNKGIFLKDGRVEAAGPIGPVLEKYLATAAGAGGAPATGRKEGLCLLSWRITNSEIGSAHSCVSRQVCRFLFQVQSDTERNDLQIGFIIRSLTGDIVISGNSRDLSQDLISLSPGTNEISVEVRVPLKAGSYQIDFAIADASLNILHHCLPEPLLTVLPSGNSVLADAWHGLVNEPVSIKTISHNVVPKTQLLGAI